jgi:hypothetical protein
VVSEPDELWPSWSEAAGRLVFERERSEPPATSDRWLWDPPRGVELRLRSAESIAKARLRVIDREAVVLCETPGVMADWTGN